MKVAIAASGIAVGIVVQAWRRWRRRRWVAAVEQLLEAMIWIPEATCRYCGREIGVLAGPRGNLRWADRTKALICDVRSGTREIRQGHEPA